MQNDFQKYIVQSKKEETSGVITLSLTNEKGLVPKFIPGQYINVYFPETKNTGGKAYSISNAPSEPVFTITVKAVGEFSNKLCSLVSGDVINASLPYGFFQPEENLTDLVMIAGGIGIAPFRSMIRDEAVKNFNRRIFLFHSIKKSDEAIFRKEFEETRNKFDNFFVTYFVTQEESPCIPFALPRRIKAENILEKITNLKNTEFLVCGSISFTRDLWKELKNNGVSEDKIYTEAFFSH